MISDWSQNIHAYLDRSENHRPVKTSFEFFPPNNEPMENLFWESIQRLQGLNPEFMSVTHGAGGTGRNRTDATLVQLMRKKVPGVAAHLTCSGSTKDETRNIIDRYSQLGINHIVALRGDRLRNSKPKTKIDGFTNAVELVSEIAQREHFEISVAGYPELHPDARNFNEEIAYLKAKVEAGADRIITQFFFDNTAFYRFRDKAVNAGIDAPIVPGLLPVMNFESVVRFARRCHSQIPQWYFNVFERYGTTEVEPGLSIAILAEQCFDLRENGVNEFHFYTLNRHHIVEPVCRLLNPVSQRDITRKTG